MKPRATYSLKAQSEKNGVCYLQILLTDHLPDIGKDRMMTDMDSSGYTFRLGSTKTWFEQNAGGAKQWLINHRIIHEKQNPTWQCRKE